MKKMKLTALLLCGVMAASVFAGCGNNSVDKEATVATFDGKEIALAVPNFAARLQQAYDDDMYTYYFGGSMWESDFSGTGVTMEDEVKNSVMDSMFEMYTLEAHMEEYGVALTEEEYSKIGDTAVAFVNANSKEALEQIGADVATVEEYLRLVTIQSKMHDVIVSEADITVSEEATSEETGEETSDEPSVEEQQNAYYAEVLATLQAGHTWEVIDDVWKTVTFDRSFTTIESVAETEAVESTEQ